MWNKFKYYNVIILLLLLTSCEKESINTMITPTEIYKDRLFFQTTQEMLDTYIKLTQLSYEEKEKWIDSVSIKEPLLDCINECQDSSILEMPTAWQILFNKDLEIQIGDTIAKYKDGEIIAKLIKNEKVCSKTILAKISVSEIMKEEDNNEISTRATVSGNWSSNGTVWIGTRNIPVKLYSDCEHRYVHEFRTVMIATSNNLIQQLFFDIKFHYKKNQGWREATGENRHIEVDLSINVAGMPGYGINWKQSFSTKNRIEHSVCYASMALVDQFNGRWNINCTGQIIHSVDGFQLTKVTDRW